MSVEQTVSVGELIFSVNGKVFDSSRVGMYRSSSYIVLTGAGGKGVEGGAIQLWFHGSKEIWEMDAPLNANVVAEYIPNSDNRYKWNGIAGKVSAFVSERRELAIVAFKFTAKHPSLPHTHEIEGFVRCKAFDTAQKDSIRED